jgi:serine/threonine-protein kinase ULK/ATG1
MPKAVDIYVLEKKIGCGQFGDVYRGYSKVDGTDVAIKTINRSKIKGKLWKICREVHRATGK